MASRRVLSRAPVDSAAGSAMSRAWVCVGVLFAVLALLALLALGAVVGVAVWPLLQEAPELVAGSAGEEALREDARDGRCEALLAAGVDPKQRDEDGNNAFVLAAKGGHAKCFEPLLQALNSTRDKIEAMKVVINITTDWEILQALGQALGDALSGREGVETLKEANGNGSCVFVRTLSVAGVNASGDDLREGLEVAVDRGFAECVKWLREAGAPPLSGLEWEERLRDAAVMGRREALVALLAAGVPVDAADGYGRTALLLAAREGHADCVTELLRACADKDRMDTYGYTALIFASEWGHVKVVKLLLDADTNVNAANDDNRTVLMYDHADCATQLLEAEADKEQMDTGGNTDLMYASRKGDVKKLCIKQHSLNTGLILASMEGYVDVVEVLLKAGANVNAATKKGLSILNLDLQGGHADCAAELLYTSADKDRMVTVGYTALMYASIYGNVDVVKMLVKNDANVNAANEHGYTALMLASRKGHTEVVEELLAAKADVNARNKYGFTALHKAALMNHADVVRVLLDHHADRSIKTDEGKLPSDLTKSDEVLQLLTSRGLQYAANDLPPVDEFNTL